MYKMSKPKMTYLNYLIYLKHIQLSITENNNCKLFGSIFALMANFWVEY